MPEVGGPLAHALRSSGGGSDKPFVLAFQDRFRGDDGRGYDRAPNAIANQVGALETVKRWHIALEWLVRRLTPRECERLQGLPDDYTLLTNWNGWRYVEEGEDPEELRSQGFQLRQTKKTKRWRVNDPDGPRYKAIGNGMARPCIGWVLTQVHKAWCEYYGVASAAEQRIASNLS
ncbi:MAG: DNA cytosine methyltransferase [Planctomycetaceae bacterium]|nr:DNA cytosine methyltransferase [Planctomycetaceae bacterium]